MNIMRRGRFLLPLVVSLVAVTMVSAQDSGTNQKAPEYSILHFDQVNPGMMERYEEGLRAWVDAFKQAKMGPEWAWYTSSSSDFTYVLVSPLKSFAELDRREAMEKEVVKAIGKDKLEALEKQGTPAIRTHHNTIMRSVAELSYDPEKSAMTKQVPGYLHIEVEWVKPDMMKQYRNALKQFRDALVKIKHPFGYEANRVMFGDASYVYVWPADSAEQYYQGNKLEQVLTQALGKQGAERLYKEWRECIWKYETADATPRPDLSYVPVPAAN